MRSAPPNQTGKHWKLSSETKRRQSVARTGLKLSVEHRAKLSESHKGLQYPNRKSITLSLQHRKKISDAHKKNPFWKGKKHSQQTKDKVSKTKKGTKLSLITRQRMSEARKGAGNNSWKGGITAASRLLRRTLEYKLWRTAVFQRDRYMCIWGGKAHGNKLHADHIKRWADYPELRFAIDNGRTLCEACHKTTDTYGGKKQI